LPTTLDIAAALAHLGQDVYDRGDYCRERADPHRALTEAEFVALLDPAHEGPA
jgi:hypothetical protein